MRNLIAALALSTVLVPLSAEAQEKITLNWALWDWNAVAYYKPLIEAYQAANPNVTINHTDLGSNNYNQMIMTQLTGGASSIDIVTVRDTPNYVQLVSTNALADLKPLIDTPIDLSKLDEAFKDLTSGDKLYAVPFRSDIWIVYYNKRLFDAAGVSYPTNDMTYAQFDELARTMTKGFGSAKIYGLHLHTWRSTVQMPAILDGKHTLVGTDYSFLAPWYERVLSLQEDGVVQRYAALKSTNTHYSGPFYNEQVAMMPMGSWFIATQIAKVKSGESLAADWGIVTLPHPEGVPAGTTATQATGIGVSSRSANKEAAADFVEFVSGPEGARIVASTGTLPAIRDEATLSEITSVDGFPKDEGSREALKTTKTYVELPPDPNAARIELVLNRAHDEIMTNNVSVADGIAEMNSAVGQILAR